MKNVAMIMTDHVGYPNRAALIKHVVGTVGVPFYRVSPADKPQEGALTIDVPAKWLPTTDTPLAEKHWWRNHLHYLQAVRMHDIKADYYWCFEGDVAGSPVAWLRLLELTDELPHDGLWTRLYTREQQQAWFAQPSSPSWAQWYCLGAIFRVSARALDWWEESAEETRETFTEVAAPSVIARRGGTIGKINQPGKPSLYHCGTMMFNPRHASRHPPYANPSMLRHPCKYDDPIFDWTALPTREDCIHA